MLEIRRFEKEDITRVVEFEQELRRQEPDTYYWQESECKRQGVGLLIALMAENEEAQRFYRNIKDASIHDTAIWMDIK